MKIKDTIEYQGVVYKLQIYNDRYYVTWTENGRSKRKTTKTRDLAEASAFLAEFVADMDRRPRIIDVFNRHFEDALPTTKIRAKSISKHVEAFFGDTTTDDITRSDFDRYTKHALKTRAPGTVSVELSYITAALRENHENGGDPCPPCKMPKRPESRARFLDAAESGEMIRHSMTGDGTISREEAWLRIALSTGARKQAILDLKWDQVDLDNRLIHFLPNGDVQTKKRRSTVRMNDFLLNFMKVLREDSDGDNVIPEGKGKLDYALGKIAEKAGVKDFHPHLTRHTAATKMMMSGVSIYEAAKVLGCSIAMIEKTYGHWSPHAGAAATDALA